MIAVVEDILRVGGGDDLPSFFDGEDIDAVLSARVDVYNFLSVPFRGHRDFEDRIFRVQLDIVEYFCGIELHRQFFRDIVVGIHHFVRAVAEKEFALDFRGRFGTTYLAPRSLRMEVISRED